MAIIGQLRIPKHHYGALAKLLHLDEGAFQMLIKVFQEKPPTISRENYTTYVVQNVDVDANDVADMLDVLISLYSVRNEINLSSDDFVDTVVQAIGDTQYDALKPSDGDWSTIKDRIRELLSFDHSLGIIAKSSYLLTQHERVFQEARVFTDVRPIFSEDAQVSPIGGLIVHQLRIAYFEDNELKEFFVALDMDDIDKLRTQLNRADAKARSISSLLKSSSLMLLESAGD
jgi:hypothetical protein